MFVSDFPRLSRKKRETLKPTGDGLNLFHLTEYNIDCLNCFSSIPYIGAGTHPCHKMGV